MTATATLLTSQQSQTPLAHVMKAQKEARKKVKKREELDERWKVLDGKYNFKMEPQLLAILDTKAVYDVKKQAHPGKLFRKIVDNELLTQVIQHQYFHRPEFTEKRNYVSLKTALIFLAQRLSLTRWRAMAKGPLRFEHFEALLIRF